jgi:hypothetical protein
MHTQCTAVLSAGLVVCQQKLKHAADRPAGLTDEHMHVSCVQDIYKYLDILLFVEATVYQMDEENEALCEALTRGSISDTLQQHTFQGVDVVHWHSRAGHY